MLTEEELFKKTQGYMEIPIEFWSFIKAGTYIKYINSNDEFKQGGIVIKNPVKLKEKETLIKPEVNFDDDNNLEYKSAMMLKSMIFKPNTTPIIWTMKYEEFKKIYIKIDAALNVIIHKLDSTIESVNLNMKKISTYINKLESRLSKLEAYSK
jgi:hypothetical protein